MHSKRSLSTFTLNNKSTMKFALLALTIAVASADLCSHTTCKMVKVDSLLSNDGIGNFPNHIGKPLEVMQITHSNEENVCHKHTDEHTQKGTNGFTWTPTGNQLHCKVTAGVCECHKLGTNGALPVAQGVNHDLTIDSTTSGTAAYPEGVTNTKDTMTAAQRVAQRDTKV